MSLDNLTPKARELDSFFYALADDVIQVTHIMEQRGDELSHRLYVRTVFAFVEGVIQSMKSATLLFDELNNPRLLTAEEVTVLKEEDVQLGEHGKVEIKKRKISLLSNFEFALYSYAKIQRQEFALDKGGEGWRSLREAIRIRDRLTHPHTLKDLEVPLADLEVVERGMQFFRESTVPLVGRKGGSAERANRDRGRPLLTGPLPHHPACGSAPGGSRS